MKKRVITVVVIYILLIFGLFSVRVYMAVQEGRVVKHREGGIVYNADERREQYVNSCLPIQYDKALTVNDLDNDLYGMHIKVDGIVESVYPLVVDDLYGNVWHVDTSYDFINSNNIIKVGDSIAIYGDCTVYDIEYLKDGTSRIATVYAFYIKYNGEFIEVNDWYSMRVGSTVSVQIDSTDRSFINSCGGNYQSDEHVYADITIATNDRSVCNYILGFDNDGIYWFIFYDSSSENINTIKNLRAGMQVTVYGTKKSTVSVPKYQDEKLNGKTRHLYAYCIDVNN